MNAKCVSGEAMKRGGKEQHSKIGPVNNGEDVAECGWGGETNRARMCAVAELRVRESTREERAGRPWLIIHTTRNRTENRVMFTFRRYKVPQVQV